MTHPVPYSGVPAGTSRLRVIPLATHTETELDTVLDAFERVGGDLGVV